MHGALWLQVSYCRSNKKELVSTNKEEANTQGVQVYPNPFSNCLTIEFNTQEGYNCGVIVNNATGQLVQQFTQLKTSRVIFELDNQTSGVYYYQVLENGKSIYSGKVLME